MYGVKNLSLKLQVGTVVGILELQVNDSGILLAERFDVRCYITLIKIAQGTIRKNRKIFVMATWYVSISSLKLVNTDESDKDDSGEERIAGEDTYSQQGGFSTV